MNDNLIYLFIYLLFHFFTYYFVHLFFIIYFPLIFLPFFHLFSFLFFLIFFRFMSAYEQKVETPDKNFQYLLFACDPYETIAFKIPNKPVSTVRALSKYCTCSHLLIFHFFSFNFSSVCHILLLFFSLPFTCQTFFRITVFHNPSHTTSYTTPHHITPLIVILDININSIIYIKINININISIKIKIRWIKRKEDSTQIGMRKIKNSF